MPHASQRLAARWRAGALYRVYDLRDEQGRGRLCMTIVAITGSIVGQLSGGFFYTGFLVGYGIDIVGIGIITFVPSLCCLLNVFSPMILERFKHRKLPLAIGRLAYYAINILGITLLPVLVKDKTAQLWGFVAIVVLANSINVLMAPGYSAWQANFLPEPVRADYSLLSGCISSCIAGIVVFLVSLLTDSLSGSPRQLEMIVLFRYFAFALAIVDVIVISLPKEYPYPRTDARIRLSDTFTLPVRNRRFLLTVVILCLYNFANSLPSATLSAYLLSEVGVSYSFLNGILSVFFVFYLVFGNLWSRIIRRNTWFRATGFFVIAWGVSHLVYAFVTPGNYLWLLLAVRLVQHFLGVGGNTITGSLYLVNLPEENRTNYIAFYSICANIASFVGLMLGTGFTALLGDRKVAVLGLQWSSTPVLLFVCGVLLIGIGSYIFMVLRKVTPPELLQQMDMYLASRSNRSRRAG